MSKIKKRLLKVSAVVVVFLLTQNILIWALKPIDCTHWINEDIKKYKRRSSLKNF